jgi:hypothetical protein
MPGAALTRFAGTSFLNSREARYTCDVPIPCGRREFRDGLTSG